MANHCEWEFLIPDSYHVASSTKMLHSAWQWAVFMQKKLLQRGNEHDTR